MSQPSLFTSITWTVSRLTQHIRMLLESDVSLQDIWVQGEISNLSRPASGHMYFTLKDSAAALRGVMWKTDVQRLQVPVQVGMEIEVHGRIGVYEPQGQYQFYADLIRPLGEGQLFQEFLRLKARLEDEGLFAVERKQPIPDFPGRIGVVTSPTGAALRDILNTLQRRLPLVEVILAPSAVQGVEAPPALVAALVALDHLQPDVILLARGGGSMEDLWAFNDERVERAVAGMRTPVISGVGHETDFTLCDFAADLRAPTPTAAAELGTPVSMLDLKSGLMEVRGNLSGNLLTRLEAGHQELELLGARLISASPLQRIRSGRQLLDDQARSGLRAIFQFLRMNRLRLSAFERRLAALSPLAVLARGYAIVTDRNGGLVSQVAQVESGDRVDVRVSDGTFGAEVMNHKES